MKIAIHDSKKEHFFSERWIEYCSRNNIPFKVVNAYDNDIINQLKDCDIFMWHHSNYDYRDALFAKQLIYSLETIGVKVFPDFHTTWHFDDKVGQKYLLEAIGAPLVPSFVFYSRKDAYEWIKNTDFPKVFKLRGGSGSSNVQLVKNKQKAKNLVDQAFGKGFSQFDRINHLKFRYKKFRSGKGSIIGLLKGIARTIIGTEYSKNFTKEKGYIHFQEFIPDNKFDIRVIVIGNKAFALKRLVRDNDFRASGSGKIIYDINQIDVRCIQIAFMVNNNIKAQSIAYDFVFDLNNNPLIVEISYGFDVHAYDRCEGYFDSSLKWHDEKFNPQEWMVEDIIQSIKKTC